MLDIPSLLVVREVARCGSFGQAARSLAYTPPAVSQRVAALEREHGVRLFERSRRGVRLTPAGRLLLEHAERILQATEVARADLAAAAEYRRGRIRLGTFATAAAGPLVEALRVARAELGLEIEVVEGEPYALLPRLLARELDLAVVFGYPGQPASISFEGRASVDESDLGRVQLGEDPLLLVTARDHRLAGRASVRRSELRGETFVPVSPLMPTFPGVERHLGFRPRFAPVETADYQVVLGAVAAGLGMALVPRTVFRQAGRGDVESTQLAGKRISRRVDVVLPAGGGMPHVTRALVDTLVDAFAAAGLDRPPGTRRS
jgi:DNA-binding transcriptional LysR family regulator